jgi:prolyl-tRNA editing enzyme YbaK/EbsC (Cys-tRNA(Pro) deacylase)
MLTDDPSLIEATVRDRLAALDVEHETLACDPDFADTAAFCARYGVPPQQSANTIVVAARKEPGVACACVVLATCRLDVNHAVCDLLGLPDDLPLYIDPRVLAQDSVVIGGGSRSLKIRLAPAGLLRLPGARVVDGLANVVEVAPA